MSKLDLARLADRHIQVLLSQALNVYGLNAKVFKQADNDSIYRDLEMLDEHHSVPFQSFDTRVLIQEPFGGILVNEFISVSDKLQENAIIYCIDILQPDWVIKVLFPDGKDIDFRIVTSNTIHNHSTLLYKYEAVAD
jgi:hypothetical protein